jgi:hypothetical protein
MKDVVSTLPYDSADAPVGDYLERAGGDAVETRLDIPHMRRGMVLPAFRDHKEYVQCHVT